MKEECAPDEFYLMLGYNLSVPPHVRRALLSRSVHNDDLLPTLNKPVLIVHGEDDRFVKRIASERQRDAIPHARLEIMPNVGHAPFWEDAATFNRLVHAFSEQVSMEAVA
jgi:pimeloyl-ACP methyl ester carboxylesterase